MAKQGVVRTTKRADAGPVYAKTAKKPELPECPYLPVNEALIVRVIPWQEEKSPGGVVLTPRSRRYEQGCVAVTSPHLFTREGVAIKPGMIAIYLAGSGDAFTTPAGTFKRLSVASIHCLRRTA